MPLLLAAIYQKIWNSFSYYLVQKVRILGEESDPPGSYEDLGGTCEYDMEMVSANVRVIELCQFVIGLYFDVGLFGRDKLVVVHRLDYNCKE